MKEEGVRVLFTKKNNDNLAVKELEFSTSFFSESLAFLVCSDFLNEQYELQEIIQEAFIMGDNFMLNEGYNDYVSNITKYIKSIIKHTNASWSKFELEHKMAKDEVMGIVVDGITKIDVEALDYSFMGYNYSIKDENTLIKRYLVQSEKDIVKQLKGNMLKEEVRSEDEDYFDRLRGSMVGQPRISSDKYERTLKKYFREGKLKHQRIEVTDELKEEIIDVLFEGEDNLRTCIFLKNAILEYCQSLLTYFNNLTNVMQDKQLRSEISDIDNRISYQTNIARKVLSIYIMFLNAKMDAINERHNVYIKIVKDISRKAGEDID